MKIKVLLVTLGIISSITILEIYARLIIGKTYTQTLPSFFQENLDSIVALKPNTTRILKSKKSGEFNTKVLINSQGLRSDYDYQIPKTPNTYRILMLGDSITFGYGVQNEQTFSAVLEESLNQKYPQRHFEVINAGLASGFTWDEAYLYLAKKGLIFQPDLIIENIFLANDIGDLEDHTYQQIDELKLPQKIISKTTYVSNGSLRSKPQVPAKTPKLFLAGIFNRFLCDQLALCQQIIRPFVDRNITKVDLPFYQFSFLEEKLSPEVEVYWQTGQKILIGLRGLAETADSRFMIVNIPIKEQLWDPHNILKDKQLNQTRLQEFLRKSQIPYCETSEKLKEQPELSYFPYDSHLTATGHRQVARAIENCILLSWLS